MAYRVSALLLTLMLLAAACGGDDGAAPDDGASPAPTDEAAATEPADGTTDEATDAATDEATEGAAAEEPAEELPDEVVVAGTISQTGPFAGAVTDFDELAHNYAAMVNEEGGLDMCGQQVDLRFEFVDDASDQAQARRLYEQLAADDPALLMGPYSSPLSFAASPVAESAQIPMLMAEANSDAIYSQGFEWVFGILDSGGTWSDNMFATITQFDDPPQSIGFVVEENLSNQEIYEGAKANAEEAGMDVLVEETLGGDTQDFTPAIERLRESDPDVVYISSFEPFAVTFVRQALEQGLSPRLIHVAKYGATFVEALGEQANGVSGEHYWLPGIEGEGVDQFEALLEETGLEVGDYPWTAIRMPVFQVIRNLFETACSVDPQTLRDTLAGLETETIAGTIAFKENGAGTLKPFPSQIQEGEFRIVGPPEQAEADYIYPAEY